ncbi:hypothetical protein R1sor_001408 [Riccia sorocarpa]|uniref:Small ribosomal subunit protein bS18c n=1 Tax=Riccia sorocarpa TaxID=122646 RepID=A0ABD3GXU2_9MARC
MSSTGRHVVRLRSGFVNFPSVDQLLKSWQKIAAGSSRSISVTSLDELSDRNYLLKESKRALMMDDVVESRGNGEPRNPVEDAATQYKESPEAAGDKRLWRKWIEERLAHSKAGEEKFPATDGSSSFEDDVAGSSLSADDVVGAKSSSSKAASAEKEDAIVNEERTSTTSFFSRSTSTRLQPTEDEVAPHEVTVEHTTESLNSTEVFSGSTDLGALISESLKPSTLAGDARFGSMRNRLKRDSPRSSLFEDKENTRRSTIKSSLFEETSKRSTAQSAGNQKANGTSPQLSLDFELPKVDPLDEFEHRVLGSGTDVDDTREEDDFLRELDEIGRSARGIRDFDEGEEGSGVDEDEEWDDGKAEVLTDLALSNLEEFDLEDEERPYRLRPDRLFFPGQTYDPEDLDISKPAAELEKPTNRTKKNYSSKEVYQIADFRNPRYLSNFIRESSRILPRRNHQVSAKAQRKIAREIKTARILGLMPFTSMGEPPFRFMRSRGDDDAYPGSEDEQAQM